MVNKHISLEDLFADIADAIREKTGDTETIPPAEFPSMIREKLQITQTAPPLPCLTFRSPNSFTLEVSDMTKHWNGTLEYSTDKRKWTVWNGRTVLSSDISGSNNVLHLRGTGNTVITGDYSGAIGDSSKYKWVLIGSDIVCSGNIETLLDCATVRAGNHPTMASYCYHSMFEDCESLIAAPRLPATTLTPSCYDEMFQGCKNLTITPDLPATTLADHCYHSMFKDCTNLITVPALPSTTLDSNCYERMFQGCLALTTVPALPATTLAENCYNNMFKNCANLIAIPALPATTLTNNCYHEMFQGCLKLELSSNNIGKYTLPYRIPTTGDGTTALLALTDMFDLTGGLFKGTPDINTTYYLSDTNTIVG